MADQAVTATTPPGRTKSPKDKSPKDQASRAAESHEAALEAQTTIAADPELEGEGTDEDDEGYDTDGASRGSTSISSSVRDYTFENNRRYHKFQEGRYHFPNDEPEQEREDMKHAMIVNLMNGKLHLAPLENPQRVLDVGTGTGIWAIDSKPFLTFCPRVFSFFFLSFFPIFKLVGCCFCAEEDALNLGWAPKHTHKYEQH